MYINRQIKPTAVIEVTIGIKNAVWKKAIPLIFWFNKYATKTAIAVLSGTTNKTYKKVLINDWKNSKKF